MKIIKRTGMSGTTGGCVVTVDWVVLAAAVVGLAIALLTSLHGDDDKLARAIAEDPDNAGTFSSTFR